MMTVLTTTALFAAVFLSATVEAHIRIGLLTSADANSGTNCSVGFRVTGDNGTTKWLWPSSSGDDFSIGQPLFYTFKDQKGVGDMKKLDIWVKRPALPHDDDDWKGYKIILSDKDTKKAFFGSSDWVKTEHIKTVELKPMACKDTDPGCTCNTSPDVQEAFRMHKHQIDECPLTCEYCFDPNPGNEVVSGEGETQAEEGISEDDAASA